MGRTKGGKRNPLRVINAPGTKSARPGRNKNLPAISPKRWGELHNAELQRIMKEEGQDMLIAGQKAHQVMISKYRKKKRS
jgi:hypothetical protein